MVWKKLAKDRRVDKGWKYGPVFGKYSYTSLGDKGKTIRVGDVVKLTKRTKERPVFGKSCNTWVLLTCIADNKLDWPLPKAVVSAFK